MKPPGDGRWSHPPGGCPPASPAPEASLLPSDIFLCLMILTASLDPWLLLGSPELGLAPQAGEGLNPSNPFPAFSCLAFPGNCG